jgi:hypothetical protein
MFQPSAAADGSAHLDRQERIKGKSKRNQRKAAKES